MSETAGPAETYVVATDLIGADDYQLVKLVDGTVGSTTVVPYSSNAGFIVNTGKSVRVAATPTISTTIYAIGDAVGGLLTFANCARFSGAGGVIQGVTLIDKDQERVAMNLILFNQTFTASADNAAFDPTDADLANCIAGITVATTSGDYFNFNDNAVTFKEVNIPFAATGTSLFGQLQTQGTPTFTATSDIIVILNLYQE